MTAEQFLDINTTILDTEFGFANEQIIKMMKEYATLCCEAQKIACADEAIVDYVEIDGNIGVFLIRKSILNTKNVVC